jgi:hypothetical protein
MFFHDHKFFENLVAYYHKAKDKNIHYNISRKNRQICSNMWNVFFFFKYLISINTLSDYLFFSSGKLFSVIISFPKSFSPAADWLNLLLIIKLIYRICYTNNSHSNNFLGRKCKWNIQPKTFLNCRHDFASKIIFQKIFFLVY